MKLFDFRKMLIHNICLAHCKLPPPWPHDLLSYVQHCANQRMLYQSVQIADQFAAATEAFQKKLAHGLLNTQLCELSAVPLGMRAAIQKVLYLPGNRKAQIFPKENPGPGGAQKSRRSRRPKSANRVK